MIRRSKPTNDGRVKVTFALAQDEPSGPVSVVGTFNDWEPGKHVLTKRTNGTRSVSIDIPLASTMTFRYLGPNDTWIDDPDADEVTVDGSVLRT